MWTGPAAATESFFAREIPLAYSLCSKLLRLRRAHHVLRPREDHVYISQCRPSPSLPFVLRGRAAPTSREMIVGVMIDNQRNRLPGQRFAVILVWFDLLGSPRAGGSPSVRDFCRFYFSRFSFTLCFASGGSSPVEILERSTIQQRVGPEFPFFRLTSATLSCSSVMRFVMHVHSCVCVCICVWVCVCAHWEEGICH